MPDPNSDWHHRSHDPRRLALTISCQLESIQRRAFDSLRLVVELDLSWNQLKRVPLVQLHHLSLLRRLSMRGNPLGALDERTFELEEREIQPGEPDREQPRSELDRLVETYPELVRTWARQGQTTGLAEAELELLERAFDLLDEPQSELDSLTGSEQSASSGNEGAKLQLGRHCCSLGSHFLQLQELDFGRCQLSYIKWTTFEQLEQLKRLWLDGNQLR